MSKAYVKAMLSELIASSSNEIVGQLETGSTEFSSQWATSVSSWYSFIELLKNFGKLMIQSLPQSSTWHVLLEYEIPRIGGRIDAIILASDIIYVVEYKQNADNFFTADMKQVEDYSSDLFDFHFESRGRVIIPILLAENAKDILEQEVELYRDNLLRCLRVNKMNFAIKVFDLYLQFGGKTSAIDADKWEVSAYQPTPSIIQAARSIYAGHKVENISRAGAENLKDTSTTVIDIIEVARKRGEKVVCFITGVPGSGKTLVGLNVVLKENDADDQVNAAYFSGNTPLVEVLTTALERDSKARNEKGSSRGVRVSIQNLHMFIKDNAFRNDPPYEKIVVFDEAQRCWSADQLLRSSIQSRTNDQKKEIVQKISGKSEPELLFEIMGRHIGWAAIIALVGIGQEINTGEAGIKEWCDTILRRFKDWKVYASEEIFSHEGRSLESDVSIATIKNPKLELRTSQRAFRASGLDKWVTYLISGDSKKAAQVLSVIHERYPVYVTRKLELARNWLRSKKYGNKRVGIITSSGALRLRPFGIWARDSVNTAAWFLNEDSDIRSSNFLEVVPNEYKVQGLEIDYGCVCWDGDLRRSIDNTDWVFKQFRGSEWQQVSSVEERGYFLNTYRVLLTRSREGIVIFVPAGDYNDQTRSPLIYDPIYEYIVQCGATELT